MKIRLFNQLLIMKIRLFNQLIIMKIRFKNHQIFKVKINHKTFG